MSRLDSREIEEADRAWQVIHYRSVPFAIGASDKTMTDDSRVRRAGRKQLRAALAEMPPKYQKLVIDYERYADPDDGERFLSPWIVVPRGLMSFLAS